MAELSKRQIVDKCFETVLTNLFREGMKTIHLKGYTIKTHGDPDKATVTVEDGKHATKVSPSDLSTLAKLKIVNEYLLTITPKIRK